MKKLLIIILLLFSINAFGQVYFSGTRQPSLYNVRASEFFTRCETAGITLTTVQKSWYNDSIFVPLSDSGLIGASRSGDSIQALWCFATFPNGSASICVLNLLSDSNTCTAVNSPTFTDSGVVGNGSSSYLNTNFNMNWDSTIFKKKNNGLGYLCLTNSVLVYKSELTISYNSEPYYWWGFSTGSVDDPNYYVGCEVVDPKNNLKHSSTRKLFSLSRKSNTSFEFYVNSVMDSSYNFNTIGVTWANESFPILCAKVNGSLEGYSTRVVTFAFFTSGLSDDKSRALHNILNNSLKGRGYNVY